jgi:hypothetical protein
MSSVVLSTYLVAEDDPSDITPIDLRSPSSELQPSSAKSHDCVAKTPIFTVHCTYLYPMRTILLTSLLICLPVFASAQTCETVSDDFIGFSTLICLVQNVQVEQQPNGFIEENNVF